MAALDLVAGWRVPHAAAGWLDRAGHTAVAGEVDRAFPLASVTKLFTTLATLVAVEEGSVDLDGPAAAGVAPNGGEVVTVRHLLAHTSGLAFEGDGYVAPLGRRRIYSNTGIERVADHVATATGFSFVDYLREAVLDPLDLAATDLGDRSPAAGAVAPVGDVLRLGAELLAPTLIAPATLAEATTVQFPGRDGILPGFGTMKPCDWGLGFELRDGKSPHWTGTTNAPGTFGHFGGSGTFLWVDPIAGVACAGLTDRAFDDWARSAWPALGDAVLAEAAEWGSERRTGAPAPA